MARRIAHTGEYVRRGSPLPADVRELATIATARELDCLYEWNAHEGGARREGVREEAIAAIRDRAAPEVLTSDERLVVTFVQELIRNKRVQEATFQAALQRFGIQQLVDLAATVGQYCMLACVLNAFEVVPDTEPLLPV
jgi:4-carboxymuconolactone decarboxylase